MLERLLNAFERSFRIERKKQGFKPLTLVSRPCELTIIIPMWLNSASAVVLAYCLIAKSLPQTTHSPLGSRASLKTERERNLLLI